MIRPGIAFRSLLVGGLLAASLIAALPCRAVQIPGPGTGRIPAGLTGYTVSVDENWVECRQGMYPIRVSIETNPPLPVVNDQRFTVSVTYQDHQPAPYIITTPIVIRSGSKSGEADIYVPAVRAQHVYNNRILIEKGEYDGRMGAGDLLHTPVSNHNFYNQNNQPSLLLISSTSPVSTPRQWICYQDKKKKNRSSEIAPSVQKVAVLPRTMPSLDHRQAMFQSSNRSTASNPTFVRSTISSNELLLEVAPGQLPENWIGLSGVDQILISISELKTICLTNELQKGNLEKWVAAGGSLIVFDAGPKFQEADKIWSLLLGKQRAFDANRRRLRWLVPGPKLSRSKNLILNDQRYQGRSGLYSNSKATSMIQEFNDWKPFDQPTSFPDSARFGISKYVNGSILVVGDNMSTWTKDDWRLLQNAITLGGGALAERIGLTTGTNPTRHFGIPGVGQPPVTTFQILIGMFLLIAGPVMLIVLRRTDQLQFLFVAVPLISAVVCFSLFLFATLVDGSKQWGRAQTVTTIDHRTGIGVTHARTAYYSGAHPGPYRYPKETFVVTANNNSNAALLNQFGFDELKVSGGNIRPRMPHELTSIRCRSIDDRLIIKPAGQNPESSEPVPSIQNQLGADAALVLFKDKDGKLYLVTDLQAGQSAEGKLPTDGSMRTEIRKVLRRLAPTQFDSLYDRNRYYDDNQGGEEGRVVEVLRQNDVVDVLRKNNMASLLKGPNSYLAILEQLPFVSDQLEPVQYKLQLHVVLGQW